MGFFVNGSKMGTVTTSSTSFTDISISTILQQGTAVIELKDSEGTSELNVDYLTIVFIKPVSSIEFENTDSDTFSIYPNPLSGNDMFFINLGRNPTDKCIVEIYSMNGRKVYRKAFDGSNNCLKIENVHLPDSLYIVGVISDRKAVYSKLTHYL
jgi:hypothetical protein